MTWLEFVSQFKGLEKLWKDFDSQAPIAACLFKTQIEAYKDQEIGKLQQEKKQLQELLRNHREAHARRMKKLRHGKK